MGIFTVSAQENKNKTTNIKPKKEVLTTEKQEDSLSLKKEEIISTIKDSTAQDSTKKSILADKVKYKAEDYVKMSQDNKEVTLYNKAELYYQDIELKSGKIIMNYEKNEAYAGRIKDSTGTYVQYPYFKQGNNVIEPDSIRFNYKTKKALIWNSRTQQGEMYVKGEISKRENDSVYFIKNARFTTSENIDNPEYYFLSRKIKLVPKKKVVTGLTNLVIADVPTPIGLPFAFFPMTNEARSGIIVPTFQDTRRQGYSLQNGGLYLALSKYYDLAILGDYFTNGSYALRFESNYGLRYRFNGNFNVRFENQIQSERGFPDYSKTTIYNIQWSHSQDAKNNPNSRFSASVNLGSSRFFQQSLNQVNINGNLNNTLNSSITYSKTINTIPQINMSLTATHSQNTNTQQINMTLPTFQGSMDRVFPFAKGDGPKRGIIKNINFQYNLRGENRIQTTDSLFFKPQMFSDALMGFQHSIPLSTNFKLFRYFSVTASSNYNEVWVFKTVNKSFDSNTNQVVTRIENGFDAFRTYNFTTNIGTTIYGTFNFGENKKIQAIRHTIRPSVSYNITPSFDQYFDTYALDASGRLDTYTRFENSLFGAPSNTYANTLGINITNTFEAKVTQKDSTKTEPKKVMLLKNFDLSTSYNLAADSLRWQPMRLSTGTVLFNNKLDINFATTLDPYALDGTGRRIDTYNIENGGSLFRMTSANVTLNYSLNSEENKKKNVQGARNGGRTDDLFGTNTDYSDRRQNQFQDDEIEENEEEKVEFYKSKLPWDITLAYSLTYSNNNRERKITSNTLMFSGNIDISPKWKMGISSGYDFVQQGVTFTQLRFQRDLLSWRMDFNWVPLGDNTSWGFFIGVKASVLSDLKYDRRNVPDRILR